jgi:hypothetical protein
MRMDCGPARLRFSQLAEKQLADRVGPANYLMVVDSHSDFTTGWISHAGRKADGAIFVDKVPSVSSTAQY